VDQVVVLGIPYFSAATNKARNSWVAATSFNPVNISNQTFHRFGTDNAGSPITFMRISMQGNSNLRTFVIQWDEAFASVSGSPGSRSDLDFVWRFGSCTLALILLSYFNVLLPIIRSKRPLQRSLALKALVDLCPHI
jgi:hypothetical protein